MAELDKVLSEINKLPKPTNYSSLYLLAQQAFENGFRGITVNELVVYLSNNLPDELTRSEFIYEEFPDGSTLPDPGRQASIFLGPGTYTTPGGSLELTENFNIVGWNGEDWEKVLEVPIEVVPPENKIPVWEAGTYVQGDQRIHSGQIWSVAVASTTEEPGTGTDWELAVDAPKKEDVGVVTYIQGVNLVYDLRHSDINDNNIWEDGIWSKNTGGKSTSGGHRRTKDMRPIVGGVGISYRFRLTGNAGVCFYDKDGVYLFAIWNELGDTSGLVTGQMVLPENVRSYTVSHNTGSTLNNNIEMVVVETVTIATNDVFARMQDLPATGGEIEEGDSRLVDGGTIFEAGFISQNSVLQELSEPSELPVSATAVLDLLENSTMSNKTILKGGNKMRIDVKDAVQIDIIIDTIKAFTFGGVLRVKGFEYKIEKPIFFIEHSKKYAHSSAMALYSSTPELYRIFLNTQAIDTLELHFDTTYLNEKMVVDVQIHKTHLEERVFEFSGFENLNTINAARAGLMRGYRYFQILDDVTANGASFWERPNVRGLDYEELSYNLLTKAGEKVVPDSIANWNNAIGMSVKDQGYVYEPISDTGIFVPDPSKYSGEGTVTINRSRVVCRNNLDGKKIQRSYKDFDLVSLKSNTILKDAFNGSVIEWSARAIDYYIHGYWGIKQSLNLNSVLDPGDSIENAYLIPFQKSTENSTEGTALRIWLYTVNGKAYYNYAVEGSIFLDDVNTWQESEIFNQFKPFIPINDKSKATSYKKYFPVLLNFDYGQTNDYPEPATIYERPFVRLQQGVSPFRTLTKNHIARLDHVTMFGNYNTGTGQEPFVMLTSNGGKTWYIKAYFASNDVYVGGGTIGGNVDFSPISDVSPYVENSLSLRRRRYNHPSEAVKEPSTRFILDPAEVAPVKSFSFDSGTGTMKVELSEDAPWIDTNSYNVIYFENVSADNEWNPICNTGLTPGAATTTHIFFRIRRINSREYHLYADTGNPYEGNMVVRHVHGVNATPAGFVITTGESKITGGGNFLYEGGDIYYMEDVVRNHSTARGAMMGRPVHRLSSSDKSVMRACGAYLTQNGELIYASDEGRLTVEKFTIEGRTLEIPKTPVGIYRGKLSDIDDASKFTCVKDLDYTTLSLLVNNGRIACDYKHGHTLVSPDGEEWIELRNVREYVSGFDNNGDFYIGSNLKLEWK